MSVLVGSVLKFLISSLKLLIKLLISDKILVISLGRVPPLNLLLERITALLFLICNSLFACNFSNTVPPYCSLSSPKISSNSDKICLIIGIVNPFLTHFSIICLGDLSL